MDKDSGSDDDDNAVEKTFTKGAWSQAEDNLLLAYIEKHGTGNWKAVQKNSTLSRCGQSCRFRWMTHLRPGIKKGAFTDEEEERVVQLQAEMGNKWTLIAAELPGRSDNEIKNFWNTRLKRMQPLGLPVDPDEVREQAMNAAAQSGLNTDSLDAHSSHDETPNQDLKLLLTSPSPITDSFLRQRPCVFQPNMYNSMASPSGMAFLFTGGGSMSEQSLPCFIQPNMYNSIATPSRTALPFTGGENYPFVESTSSFMRQGPCFIQPSMYNSIASPSGTTLPFTGGGSMDEQSLPLENYSSVGSTQEQYFHLLDNATYYSPSGTAYPFTGGESIDEQSLPLENYPFAESTLEHVHVLDNATHYPPFEPLIHSTEKFELPSFQVFDSHEETRTLEAQQCDLISDNTLVQPPLTDQTPSIDYGSSLYDGLLESIVYRSSGARRETETDPVTPLDMSSLLGHTELPPSTSNTTGQNFSFGSTSSEEIPSDGDWIRHLLGEDRNNTK